GVFREGRGPPERERRPRSPWLGQIGLFSPGVGAGAGVVFFLCSASANCDFLRAARLGWTMRREAALSSFFAARLSSFCAVSIGFCSRALKKRLMCVLIVFLTALLRSRRFSFLRRFFLALFVCGIYPVSRVARFSLFSKSAL